MNKDSTIENKPNVLYVDDIQSNLILFDVNFNSDFNITLAKSAKEALTLLETRSFPVIVTDQSMPEMSGTELLEITKVKYPDMLRFILTAYTDYDMVVNSINKGEIYGYFNKPFDPKEVKISLNKAIEVYNLRISNRKMITELGEVNSLLQDIDKSKTRYLNNITNEIRTPINKIMSAVHMLKDRLGSNDLSELLFYLDTSVARLESFSYAANQLARLSADSNTQIEKNDVSLRELAELCILENKNFLDKFQVVVELEEKSSDIHVTGEFNLLMTCLSTLIMNSIKHFEKNGKIRISFRESDDSRYIELIEDGSFYSKSQLENMNKFLSGSKNPGDFVPGIELILAKQIMISHDGKLTVELIDEKHVSTKMIF